MKAIYHVAFHLCLAFTVLGAEVQPWTAAAISFVEKALAADAEKGLLEESAMSEFIPDSRKDDIWLRWEGLRSDWVETESTITSLAEKRDGELAGAVIQLQSSTNAFQTQMVGVMCLEIEGVWKAAPVPGSFANVQLGYDDVVLTRARTIVNWINGERSEAVATAETRSHEAFLAQVRAEGERPEMSLDDPVPALMRFFSAARQKNLSAMMAFQGGMNDPLPEDFMEDSARLSEQLAAPKAKSPLAKIVNVNSISVPVIVEREWDDVSVALGIWNAEEMLISYEWLDMTRQEGNWRVFLSQDFAQPAYFDATTDAASASDWEQMNRHFPEQFAKHIGAAEFASIEDLGVSLTQTLNDGPFWKLGALLSRRKASNPMDTKSFSRLVSVWALTSQEQRNAPAVIAGVVPGTSADEAFLGLGNVNFDSTGSDITLLKLSREGNAWGIAPEVFADPQNLPLESVEALRAELASKVVDACAPLTEWPTGSAPTEEMARESVEKMISRFYEDGISATLPRTRRLPYEASSSTALAGATFLDKLTRNKKTYEILGVSRSGPYAGVSVRFGTVRGRRYPVDLLLCMVHTAESPHLLLDLHLRHPRNTGQRLINSRVLSAVRNADSPEARSTANHLQTLLKNHGQLVTKEDTPPADSTP